MIDNSVPETEATLEAARDALAVARRAYDAALLVVGHAALAARQARQDAAARRKMH